MEFVFKPGDRSKAKEEAQREEQKTDTLTVALCACADSMEAIATSYSVARAAYEADFPPEECSEAAPAASGMARARSASKDKLMDSSAFSGEKSFRKAGASPQKQSAKANEARRRQQEGPQEPDFSDALMPLFHMLSAQSRAVRLKASRTVGVLAEACPLTVKPELVNIGGVGVIPKLVRILEQGGLDAITTIGTLTFGQKDPAGLKACDQVVSCPGAIDIIASYVQEAAEEGPDQDGNSSGGSGGGGGNKPKGKRSSKAKRGDQQTAAGGSAAAGGDGSGFHTLADLAPNQMLPGMEAAKAAVTTARPAIVPVVTKTEAVACLRNISSSNDNNREAITRKQVIPQLVTMMTKMRKNDDDKSAQSSNSERQRQQAAATGGVYIDRAQMARDNRKLAESAGQMLHTLVLEGKAEVKQMIISAIIRTVQQPGSTPPEDVPALMAILRSAAEEQLEMCKVCSRTHLAGVQGAGCKVCPDTTSAQAHTWRGCRVLRASCLVQASSGYPLYILWLVVVTAGRACEREWPCMGAHRITCAARVLLGCCTWLGSHATPGSTWLGSHVTPGSTWLTHTAATADACTEVISNDQAAYDSNNNRQLTY